jgi:hypothetical protein
MRTRTDLHTLSGIALLLVAGCATGDDGGGPLYGGSDDASPANGGRDVGSPTDAAVPDSARPPKGVDAASDSTSDSTGQVFDAIAPADTGGDEVSPLADDAGPAPALIAKWAFDEGTGTSSADLSGHGHTATFVGGASWAAAGKEGTGLALDGTSGYADVGAAVIDTTQSFTVLCWVKLAVVNAWEIAVSQDDVTGSLFGLKLRGDATNAFDFDVETSDATNPGFIVAQSTTVATTQTWFHLAGVHDASGSGALLIYVDGALQANAAIGASVLASSGHFVMGRGLYNGVNGSFLNGTLDEVEVHAAALTGAQVAAIYAAQK